MKLNSTQAKFFSSNFNPPVALYLLIIISLGFLAYANTFHVPFVFDDRMVIVDNTLIKDLSYFLHPSKAQAVSGHFEYHSLKLRFLGYLSFAVNYAINGLNVTGYHLVNLLLHLTNSLLAYQLVIITFQSPFFPSPPEHRKTRLIAFLVGLLFVCHPVQTGAVTYTWQRITLLATSFYSLSLILYGSWRLRTSAGASPWQPLLIFRYGLALVSCAAAMECKEIAFTLPVMIAIYEGLFFTGNPKKRLLALFPFLLTMAIIPGILMGLNTPLADLFSSADSVTRDPVVISRAHYLLTELRVMLTYLRLLVLPVNQVLDYDYHIYTSIQQLPVLLSALTLFGLIVLAFFCLRLSAADKNRHGELRLVALGILWFFVTISIESSFIPLFDVIFEHRLYLPSIGFFMALIAAVFYGLKALKDKSQSLLPIVMATGVLVGLILAITTYQRNRVWSSPISLWQDVTLKSPNKARGFYQLGTNYAEAQDYQNALRALERAAVLTPNNSHILNNLGNCNFILQRPEQAELYWLKSLAHDANNAMAAYNLSMLARQQGELSKANAYLQIYLKYKDHESVR